MDPSPVTPFDLHLWDLIEQSRAIQTGHFQLASGRHARRFFRCIRLFQEPAMTDLIFAELASRFANDAIDYVLGANEAGSILAFEVAKRLSARILIARELDGSYQLIEGFTVSTKSQVLIVDDVTTTGGTIKQLLAIVDQAEAQVVGVGIIATKGLVELAFGCRTEVLTQLTGLDATDPSECQLCQQGVPFTT